MNIALSENDKETLAELKNSLNGLLGDSLVKLVLFGSKARGDDESESDMDIAIIVSGLTREIKNEILVKVADIEVKRLTPMSTIVFSEEDFNRLKERERRIALDIEKEGIIL
jgi:hypothetical protein